MKPIKVSKTDIARLGLVPRPRGDGHITNSIAAKKHRHKRAA